MQTLILPANLDALSQMSLFITEAAEHTALDERAIWQVQLAVDEAATNIIQHAYDANAPGDISLSWHSDGCSFVVMLRDQGRGFDPHEVPAPDLCSPLEERHIGGLGIYLMTRLMDEVHFDFNPHTGNLLTMVKYIASRPGNDRAVVPLSGRLDAITAPQIRQQVEELIAQGVRQLVLDLADVTFLNSSGLRTLLLIRKELMTLGGELHLAAAQPQVCELFDMTGFIQVFSLHASAAEACAALKQQQG